MPKYYSSLPTTKDEVVELLQKHGYLDEEFLSKYNLMLDKFVLSHENTVIIYNSRHEMRFVLASNEELNRIYMNSLDDDDDKFNLLIVEVSLPIYINHQSIQSVYGEGFVRRNIEIPIVIKANTRPDDLIELIYNSIDSINNQKQFSLQYQTIKSHN